MATARAIRSLVLGIGANTFPLPAHVAPFALDVDGACPGPREQVGKAQRMLSDLLYMARDSALS